MTMSGDISVVGAVGDAHRQLKDALGMSPYATFPEDAILVIRISKGKGEMNVHVDIERPQDNSKAKAFSKFISEHLEPGHPIMIEDEELTTTPESGDPPEGDPSEEVYYDTLHHYPMIRPWLARDDPDHDFFVTKVSHAGVQVGTFTHKWDDKNYLPPHFKLETYMVTPKVYWSGSEVVKRSEEIEDAFGHPGATDVSR